MSVDGRYQKTAWSSSSDCHNSPDASRLVPVLLSLSICLSLFAFASCVAIVLSSYLANREIVTVSVIRVSFSFGTGVSIRTFIRGYCDM